MNLIPTIPISVFGLILVGVTGGVESAALCLLLVGIAVTVNVLMKH